MSNNVRPDAQDLLAQYLTSLSGLSSGSFCLTKNSTTQRSYLKRTDIVTQFFLVGMCGRTVAPAEDGEALVHALYQGLLLQDAPYRCSHPLP